MYDVIIVGAGPAGASLARIIGKSCSVLLLDGRPWNESSQCFFREKCCGGLLAPAAQRVLARQGLVLPSHVLLTGQPLAVQALDLASGHNRSYPRAYHNMDRAAFEGWLLSLMPGSVEFRPETRCLGLEPGKGSWQLIVERQNERTVVKGTMVVGADGALSVVRRNLLRMGSGGRGIEVFEHYIAVQDVYDREGVCSTLDLDNAYLAFFHPEVTDFYGWCIPKADTLLVGAALPPASRASLAPGKAMDVLKQALMLHGLDLPQRLARQGCMLNRPGRKDLFLGEGGAFCIGEAAGWISPSSAEGFSYAMLSAEALGNALLRQGTPEAVLTAYRKAVWKLKANMAWKRCKSQVMFTPWLRRAVMASGITAR